MANEASSTSKKKPPSNSEDGPDHSSTNKKEPKRPLKLSGSMELEFLNERTPKKHHPNNKKINNNINTKGKNKWQPKSNAYKAFNTIIALLWILSVLIFALCIADMNLSDKGDQNEPRYLGQVGAPPIEPKDPFAFVNAVMMMIYQFMIFIFILVAWCHVGHEPAFWRNAGFLITLIIFAIFGRLLAVSCCAGVISSIVSKGLIMSFGVVYIGIALVDAILLTVCAIIWYKKNQLLRNEEKEMPKLCRLTTV